MAEEEEENEYDYAYENNMNEDEVEEARMKDFIYKYELLANKCPDIAQPFAKLIDNDDMTYEQKLKALNDSSRKCMTRIKTLNDIQAKCPNLYANLLKRKIIMDLQHFPESKITSMINGISNACNLQENLKTYMENNPGPASLSARQRAINTLENSRRPNGGRRRTRKHTRSQHKRSQHKRSQHKRSQHKRSQHKRSQHKRSQHKRSQHKRSTRRPRK